MLWELQMSGTVDEMRCSRSLSNDGTGWREEGMEGMNGTEGVLLGGLKGSRRE